MKIVLESKALSEKALIIIRRLLDMEVENCEDPQIEQQLLRMHGEACKAIEKKFGHNTFGAEISKLKRLEETECAPVLQELRNMLGLE